MSVNKPVIILQMQRMGDLVLSYPLVSWLSALHPENPVWVVGEENFFSSLMQLSPRATYFPYSAAEKLRQNSYAMIINISHRPEAAHLAGSLAGDIRLGPYRGNNGKLFINGEWQLYRASLVCNSRHNLYHWADLNALDVVPVSNMLRTSWPLRRDKGEKKSGGRVGLFVGASEMEKRPDAEFWAELAKKLLDYGHKPVFLGGAGEVNIGSSAAGILKMPSLNFCGRFSVRELAEFIGELDLFITPDTGPMHIASWVGTPVLNISIGPVNAWETGPFSPGHHVLKSAISCAGCWQCSNSLACKKNLNAKRIAFIAGQLLACKNNSFPKLELEGQELMRTRRDRFGLFELERLDKATEQKNGNADPRIVRHALSRMWQAFFGTSFGRMPQAELTARKQALMSLQPAIFWHLQAGCHKFIMQLIDIKKHSRFQELHEDEFWHNIPLLLRPLGGYIQLYLQNSEYSKGAVLKSLELLDAFSGLCATGQDKI